MNVRYVGIDLLSLAAHKFHGPKGVGALYVRKGQRCRPLLIGGPQETGRRGGTENVPGIIGMGKAAELAAIHLADVPRVIAQRDRLEREILGRIPHTFINGDPTHRLPNTTNIGFERLEAEAILLLLSEQGICASAGAACSSGSLEPSHVLLAIGLAHEQAHGTCRLTLGKKTTEQDIDDVADALEKVVADLRAMSPLTQRRNTECTVIK